MRPDPDSCFHLTADIVRVIHAVALEEFGGAEGLRDVALLEAAVAAPQATFGGFSPFVDLTEGAAAYLFYLCRNLAFIDGNKRAGLGACLVFLRLNGLEPKPDSEKWERLTFDVASSRIDREETTRRLRALVPGAGRKLSKPRKRTR